MRFLGIRASSIAIAVAVASADAPRLDAQQPPKQPPAGGMTHMPGMTHTPGMQHPPAPPAAQPTQPTQPTQSGQAAFATIAEIVRILEADSTTDWTRVDLEALRQHLIDMDAVTMRARARPAAVTGGVAIDVTGDVAVAASVRRMLTSHALMLDAMSGWHATTAPIAGGVRLTVVARDTSDRALVAHLRGLGFIGLMTQGDHHSAHHLMIARGMGAAAHQHGAP